MINKNSQKVGIALVLLALILSPFAMSLNTPDLSREKIKQGLLGLGEFENKETDNDLAERLAVLAKKVAGTEHIIFADQNVRAAALKEILKNKGVILPGDLEKFISLNDIDVESFNLDLKNAVTAMQTSQFLSFKAYTFFLEKNLEETEKYLILAESQYEIYSYFSKKLSSEMNSWEGLPNISPQNDEFSDVAIVTDAVTFVKVDTISTEGESIPKETTITGNSIAPENEETESTFISRVANWFKEVFN